MTLAECYQQHQGTAVSFDGLAEDKGRVYTIGMNKGWFKPTHGMSKSKLFGVWWAMRQRCENPNNTRYEDYGGRGIKVCFRWRKFQNFYEDMGERPDDMTLDRIDNDGDYSAINCRWSTASNQMHHQRLRNSKVPFRGVTFNRNPYKRYHAEIKYNYRKIFLGNYYSAEAAALAYDAAAIQLRDKFADTNIL